MDQSSLDAGLQVERAEPDDPTPVDDPDLDPDTYTWRPAVTVPDPDPEHRQPFQFAGDGAPWRAGL